MKDPRLAIFAAVRAARPDQAPLSAEEAHALHNILDALRVPVEIIHEGEWR